MKVAVVTPTIGKPELIDCLRSVDNQTYQDLTHYVFADGQEHFAKIDKMLEGATKVKTIKLEENIGKGWYGHRVYSACSFMVNADVIVYLDEDNWYEPDHVEKIVAKIQEGNDWVYSLRKIYDKDKKFICEDNCESLGKWPVFQSNEHHHIDTSSFGVRRDVAIRIGHAWYGQWGADRQFFSAIKQHYPKWDCTNSYTSCYRLDGNEGSVTKEFFEQGNKISKEKYNDKFPWLDKTEIRQSIGPGITII
jgi:glycosyltransferase involved in cell wall biosynthesis